MLISSMGFPFLVLFSDLVMKSSPVSPSPQIPSLSPSLEGLNPQDWSLSQSPSPQGLSQSLLATLILYRNLNGNFMDSDSESDQVLSSQTFISSLCRVQVWLKFTIHSLTELKREVIRSRAKRYHLTF